MGLAEHTVLAETDQMKSADGSTNFRYLFVAQVFRAPHTTFSPRGQTAIGLFRLLTSRLFLMRAANWGLAEWIWGVKGKRPDFGTLRPIPGFIGPVEA